LRFVTATDAFVSHPERQQILSQDGPCLEAYTTAEVVTVSDIVEEPDRWPEYNRAAIAAGYRAVMGVPVDVDNASIGALDLYTRQPRDWTDEEVEAAELLADMAAGYIANLRTLESSQRLTRQLQEALDSRVVIEQAKGVIAARDEVDVATAFQTLRRLARDRRCRIHDVAQQILDGDLHL
jgi:GAF domain-containing protein